MLEKPQFKHECSLYRPIQIPLGPYIKTFRPKYGYVAPGTSRPNFNRSVVATTLMMPHINQ